MAMRVDQELCAGCGVCADVCSSGAIYLVDHRAVIDEDLCTQCQECVDACPNGAITAVYEPAQPVTIAAKPLAETTVIPASAPTILPEKITPSRGLAPLVGAALSFLGREVGPRLIEMLVNVMERRLVEPTAMVTPPSNSLTGMMTKQRKGMQRQTRYRGGCARNRNHRGRR